MAEIVLEEEAVYSNFDHRLNTKVFLKLKNNPNQFKAQHSAWNFFGYIWFDGIKWKEEIWTYHSLQEILEAEEIEDVIYEANEKYGGQ